MHGTSSARLLSAVILSSALMACATLAPGLRFLTPRISIHHVRALQLDTQGLITEVALRVENRNPFPLFLSRVTYSVAFEGRPTAHGETVDPLDIPANGRRLVHVKMRAPYGPALAAGAVLLLIGEIPYTLKMELHFEARIGTLVVPVTDEGRLTVSNLRAGSGAPAGL
jgi:LEA14-like dessication related protein